MGEQARPERNARATYRVPLEKASKVSCHRQSRGETEEYLVVWKDSNTTIHQQTRAPTFPVCSWHALPELTLCLGLVQNYLETHNRAKDSIAAVHGANLKRKAPDTVPSLTGTKSGLLTPSASSHLSRASSEAIELCSPGPDNDSEPVYVYNGSLERRAGRFVAKRGRQSQAARLDPDDLPAWMIDHARQAPTREANMFILLGFREKLEKVPNVRVENRIDTSAPSHDFEFIEEFVLGEGVYRADPEAAEGCQKPCRPDMGRNMGCEYTKLCGCLEFAAVDERQLQQHDAPRYEQYRREQDAGDFVDLTDLPKRFPYKQCQVEGGTLSILVEFYRESRHPIYECNVNCNCGPVCKSRLVQKGRRVPLTIFKTPNRGWGVYCDEDLHQGEFVDVYVGEIITNDEADRREVSARQSGAAHASYMYGLDKFVGTNEEVTEETCYVVDGKKMGNVTRFINHSCEPNLRQFTASYNKYDLRVYDLAFFAIEDIEAGTELTFDYGDKDELDEDEIQRQREEATRDPNQANGVPCNCGAERCRGFLWT